MDKPPPQHPDPGETTPALESTAALLGLVRSGDRPARERLFARYLPRLQRWASGRLPARARGPADTNDLVQITLLKALEKVEGFEPRHEGAFLAYLRQILLNQIRDEIRRAGRRPQTTEVDDQLAGGEASPLEEAIGADLLHRYEEALERLTEREREAILLRIEMDCTYRELAEAMESPSENAARMFVTRALVKLAEAMHEQG